MPAEREQRAEAADDGEPDDADRKVTVGGLDDERQRERQGSEGVSR